MRYVKDPVTLMVNVITPEYKVVKKIDYWGNTYIYDENGKLVKIQKTL